MDWFRVYHDIIDDPKILALEPSARWFYVACMSVASRMQPRGSLPSREAMGIHLRLRNDYANRAIDRLIKSGLIEQDVKTKALRIHGWDKRQCKSDDSYARVKRFRNENGNVSETLPRVRASDTDTDTEQNTPLPPTVELAAEYQTVGLWAEQFAGDPCWALQVGRWGLSEFPAGWIKLAIQSAATAEKLNFKYVEGILRGYQREGGPPKYKLSKNGPPKLDPNRVLTDAEKEEIRVLDERKKQQWNRPQGGRK